VQLDKRPHAEAIPNHIGTKPTLQAKHRYNVLKRRFETLTKVVVTRRELQQKEIVTGAKNC